MAYETSDRSLFKLPKLEARQWQTLLPTEFLELLLHINLEAPWLAFNRRNIAEIIYYISWKHKVKLDPRLDPHPPLLPPFPTREESLSQAAYDQWVSVDRILDLQLPSTPSPAALGLAKDPPDTAFAYEAEIYILPRVKEDIFRDLWSSMPDITYFIKQLTKRNLSISVPFEPEFMRVALEAYILESFPYVSFYLLDEVKKLIDKPSSKKALQDYEDIVNQPVPEEGPSSDIAGDGVSGPNQYISVIKTISAGSSTLYSADMASKMDATRWIILRSEGSALSLEIREPKNNSNPNVEAQRWTNAYTVVARNGILGLHYAFWTGHSNLTMVYHTTQSRDEALDRLTHSSEVNALCVRGNPIKKESGFSKRFYMTWSIPKFPKDTLRLLSEALQDHFLGTGYSNLYSQVIITESSDTITITFLKTPPWLGDVMAVGKPRQLRKISIRPTTTLDPANNNLSAGAKSNATALQNTRPVSTPSTAIESKYDYDAGSNPVLLAMMSASAAKLGGLLRREPVIDATPLSEMSLAKSLETLKGTRRAHLEPETVEELFKAYIDFIQNRFPSASGSEKLRAFMRAGTDLPKDLKDIHTDRVREIQGEPQNDDTWRHLRQSSGHRRWQRYSIPTVNQLKELDDSSRQAALDLPELFGTKRKRSRSNSSSSNDTASSEDYDIITSAPLDKGVANSTNEEAAALQNTTLSNNTRAPRRKRGIRTPKKVSKA